LIEPIIVTLVGAYVFAIKAKREPFSRTHAHYNLINQHI
jgi:hypothetical protein